MSNILRGFNVFIITILLSAVPAPSFAAFNFDVGISVNFGPPALPYYEQPPCPQQNYLWMPGYWAWGDAGYYWVPGTWVPAAAPGLLWTPGYWSYNGGAYVWDAGYWAPQVGFYGGINYGFGYYGGGYVGGGWSGNSFRYNTAVTNVNRTSIRNVYINRTVVNNYYTRPSAARISYNGGRGGLTARPTPSQRAILAGRRVPLTATQRQHIATAAGNRNFYASVNHGRPQQLAVAHPFAANRRPANYTPIRSADRQAAQRNVVTGRAASAPHAARPVRTTPHVAAPPQHAQHMAAPPQHVQHMAAPPKHVQHVAAPPQHVQHMAAPPQHVQHMAAPPQHVQHMAAPHHMQAPPHASAPHASAPHHAAPHPAAPHPAAPHPAGPPQHDGPPHGA
jgi:hypothetical protein